METYFKSWPAFETIVFQEGQREECRKHFSACLSSRAASASAKGKVRRHKIWMVLETSAGLRRERPLVSSCKDSVVTEGLVRRRWKTCPIAESVMRNDACRSFFASVGSYTGCPRSSDFSYPFSNITVCCINTLEMSIEACPRTRYTCSSASSGGLRPDVEVDSCPRFHQPIIRTTE